MLVHYNLTLQLNDQGERDGIWTWHRINRLFNWLPLAALIEKKIICMHGGIGRSINHVEQIESLQRPITMEAGSIVLMDLLWSVHILDGLLLLVVKISFWSLYCRTRFILVLVVSNVQI